MYGLAGQTMYGLTLKLSRSRSRVCGRADERQARRRGRRATRRGRSVAVAAVDYRAATAVA